MEMHHAKTAWIAFEAHRDPEEQLTHERRDERDRCDQRNRIGKEPARDHAGNDGNGRRRDRPSAAGSVARAHLRRCRRRSPYAPARHGSTRIAYHTTATNTRLGSTLRIPEHVHDRTCTKSASASHAAETYHAGAMIRPMWISIAGRRQRDRGRRDRRRDAGRQFDRAQRHRVRWR